MAAIHTLVIKNFRGIKSFSQTFGNKKFVCLIGKGDAGKSTILEAISYVLSSSWNIVFHDNDFYDCNTENPIEIEATITELPSTLIKEQKFGLQIRGIDPATQTISDELEDTYQKALTIRLTVKKDLEPQWHIVNGRQAEPVLISATDRSKLNVFMIADYIDRHFSWSKGNPLYSLLKREESNDEIENGNVIIDALREAKAKIDGHKFSEFDNVVTKIKDSASSFGIDISGTETSIDFKDISVKDGRVCLHDDNIPFRLKGKGSKRLISIAIQEALAEDGGIILIDEIEQGLEPNRSQHLVRTLKSKKHVQIFITTHSRDVLVELDASDLFLMKEAAETLVVFDTALQGSLRKNPEAFFANRVLLAEGATEIGICKALNRFRTEQRKYPSIAELGVRYADGGGSKLVEYTKGFIKSSMPVCIFCDSDGIKKNNINDKKAGLSAIGALIIDWEEGDCLEVAVFKSFPFNAIPDLLRLAASIKVDLGEASTVEEAMEGLFQSIESKFDQTLPDHSFGTLKTYDSTALRNAIGIAASRGSWFKSQAKGELLGDFIFSHFEDIRSEKLGIQLDALSKWIDGNGL